MRRTLGYACAILLVGTLSMGAITQEQFTVRNGKDLIALCTPDASDPSREAALNFCIGFAVGTFRMLLQMTKEAPVVCFPANGPSRNEAIRMFINWAQQNPQYQQDAAEDIVARFILQQWPCPK